MKTSFTGEAVIEWLYAIETAWEWAVARDDREGVEFLLEWYSEMRDNGFRELEEKGTGA